MPRLCDLTCKACRGDLPALHGGKLAAYAEQVQKWDLVEQHHLRRAFQFPDFASALTFVNRVGAIAEREGHHPTIELAWGRAVVEIWTHKVSGLTESDFILAAKIDTLPIC